MSRITTGDSSDSSAEGGHALLPGLSLEPIKPSESEAFAPQIALEKIRYHKFEPFFARFGV
jgi:hypothetical protein